MRLRNVRLDDVDAYVRMRCDPVMMAELGGPVPRAGIEDKVARDVREAEADESWILIVTPDDSDEVMGHIALWTHEQVSEIGWIVLPEYQGRGVGKWGVRTVLDRAAADGRWETIHAFPAVTNAPSNGICRSVGFTLLGAGVTDYNGHRLVTNHWVVGPSG
ncbi:GNAT family N-acetyltransferase [Cryptosporangium phraense]|uniref:GNAT family N-acetyltransferase n=1 Tax=Cryptosporangium phraense TaxID=2593070 RepID=A0A545AM35_9ACTN|nr:GNAT family N-acetyltransferase [Cryptosporangium phraense]TQS42389.1 GNAT family N-acetyltransferase [Cryptosporangium phraense]